MNDELDHPEKKKYANKNITVHPLSEHDTGSNEKHYDKLVTPAGSYTDDPFQRAENSCLPQYPQVLLDVYKPILKSITDSGLRLPPYWDNVFDGSGETRMPFGPCLLDDDDTSHDGDFWLSDAAISYPGPYGRKHCAVCRPGFLIIGAGKCGTSSLYHYLVGHPHVLPAKRKQVHYYLFYYNRGMKWYLSNFATTKSMLSNKALMTGEAAPGYIPNPVTARRASTDMPGTRIILIAREPLDRAWSSYNYNYARIARSKIPIRSLNLELSKEELDDKYLFTFEEMMRAEFDVIKDCLSSGRAEKIPSWAYDENERRNRIGLPPLMDIITYCYPPANHHMAQRAQRPASQWSKLVEEYPHKIINLPNPHLFEAFIGRGMYAAQVEWWYAAFPAADITLVCSEDLKTKAAETMSTLSDFLGLPAFDFTEVVSEGMFNVAGHEGYDKATPRNEVLEEESNVTILLSNEFRKELQDFFNEHNERLFTLTGKRCPW